jgi:hypothetical protein
MSFSDNEFSLMLIWGDPWEEFSAWANSGQIIAAVSKLKPEFF